MIPGASITLGGTDYVVPPINFRVHFAYEKQIAIACKDEADVEFAEYLEAAGTILFALMQRNYPDMTRDAFNDLIDLPILRPIMNGMIYMSGYRIRPLELATTASASPLPEPALSDSSTPLPDGIPTTSSTD